MIHTFVDNLEKIDKPLFFKRISLSYFRNEDRDDETASILTFVGQVGLKSHILLRIYICACNF